MARVVGANFFGVKRQTAYVACSSLQPILYALTHENLSFPAGGHVWHPRYFNADDRFPFAGILWGYSIHIVWGGRLNSQQEMIRFETISLFSLLLISFLVAVNAGLLSLKIKPAVLKVALWLIAALFLFNTLGNLNAVSDLERSLFTPVTLLLFVFSLRLALEKKKA